MTSPLSTTSRSPEHTAQIAPGASDRTARISSILNRTVYAVAKHWLLLANTVMAAHVVLPSLPPALMSAGYTSAARLIYTAFRPLCHQLPERSFFLFGPQLTYTLEELQRLVGPDVPLRYVGSADVGYKLAVCQRDIAMYLAVLLAGLVFVSVRRRLGPLSLKIFAVCQPLTATAVSGSFTPLRIT